jgi:hypothetical protein
MDIFAADIVGYKNKINKNKSQDYLDYKVIKEGVILAVADGHSTNYFKYSDIGAKYACMCAIEILSNISKDMSEISYMLEEKIIQKSIYDKWIEMVEQHYKKVNPVVYKTEFLKYSTTLLASLITDDFKLYLKIGDGSILKSDNEKFDRILDLPKKYIVDSFGREDSYININYHLEKNQNSSEWIILFTDGYENAYKTDEALFDNLKKTINKYNSNVFSKSYLKINYKNYLSKLSKKTSKDDIAIIFAKLS